MILRSLEIIVCFLCACGFASAQTTRPAEPLAIRGDIIYTMSGDPLRDGVILLRDGKIERVGRAAEVQIPAATKTIRARVVTPGLIDAHTIVGLQGYLNEPREQDMLEKSAPIQAELRAVDAFNGATTGSRHQVFPREPFDEARGVTDVHACLRGEIRDGERRWEIAQRTNHAAGFRPS